MIHLDFETYSEAGYTWLPGGKLAPGNNRGIGAVGTYVYATHPTTRILCLAYAVGDGEVKGWAQGEPAPMELLEAVRAGKHVTAHNSMFEFLIWNNCTPEAWPRLQLNQMRCTASRARAYGLPGSLKDSAILLNLPQQKDTKGTVLISKYCVPHNKPVTPDIPALLEYCKQDVETERALDKALPPLRREELDVWLLDQVISYRGVAVDTTTLNVFKRIVTDGLKHFNGELTQITGGIEASKVAQLQKWLAGQGHTMESLDKDHIKAALASELPSNVRRVLEIRALAGSSSVKKVFSMANYTAADGRVHDLLKYCGAERTGRFSGQGPQPQNLPNSARALYRCTCGEYSAANPCVWCGSGAGEFVEWDGNSAENVIANATWGGFKSFTRVYGDAINVVSGSLRGLFVPREGHDFLCADYSAIEAVVLAVLAGEQWRIDVFKTHGKIYEMSASKISGVPFQEFLDYKKRTGEHHPLRKKIGKVAELASGYAGGLGAWKAFGADKFMTDTEIEASKAAWRAESPMIVAFWRGLERCAKAALKNPGSAYAYRGIQYQVNAGVLSCTLPSGRKLYYHQAHVDREGNIRYIGREDNRVAFVFLKTHGGKLTENVVQAVARDLLVYAMLNLEKAGYPVVLHVHDEIVSEVPEGFGSVEEFESIMATLPKWAGGWPVKAAGWRGKRYKK